MKTRKAQPKSRRCAHGKALIKAWVHKYNQNVKLKPHEDMSWQTVLFRGYNGYALHAQTCPSCKAFEQNRLARYK